LQHDPEKHGPDAIRGGNRFSEKIMLPASSVAIVMAGLAPASHVFNLVLDGVDAPAP
jgi:hypothetical protein